MEKSCVDTEADVSQLDAISGDWWDERLAAMETVLGKSDGMVSHAVVPFQFGYDVGGRADVVHFREHLAGVVHATCQLIGLDSQMTNKLGNYELAICHRDEEPWGIGIISALAYYTLETRIEPGQTMDLGPAVPRESTLAAFLFLEFGRFTLKSRKAGLLLCIGITSEELAACRSGNSQAVEMALVSKGVYPFTDLRRSSVLD